MDTPLEIPSLVRKRAEANGAAGQQWLDSLPEALARLADRWKLVIGEAFTGGTAGLVVAATDADGNGRVLKIAMPLDYDDIEAFRNSIIVHRLADGQGCARIYEHENDPPSMLLERLGRNLAELELGVDEVLEVVTSTLRSFWRPVDASCGLPSGADKAVWLSDYIVSSWAELGEPCDRAVIDRAIQYCEERAVAFDADRAVLVHGDAHGWNTVEAGDGTYKFVDPEGLVSDPAHDLSVPMREYNGPLLEGNTKRLVRARAELLAGWCAIDPEPVWQWGFIERVSTGLAGLRDFGDGSAFLEVAERCL